MSATPRSRPARCGPVPRRVRRRALPRQRQDPVCRGDGVGSGRGSLLHARLTDRSVDDQPGWNGTSRSTTSDSMTGRCSNCSAGALPGPRLPDRRQPRASTKAKRAEGALCAASPGGLVAGPKGLACQGAGLDPEFRQVVGVGQCLCTHSVEFEPSIPIPDLDPGEHARDDHLAGETGVLTQVLR